jgi:ABC-type uncharacterized transport system involved in gliding motility auxiliary subunit
MPGYYYFKQVSRVGQPGMAVARVVSNDSEIGLIAFASNDTEHPDAFVVINMADHTVPLDLEVAGTEHELFTAHRTSAEESYVPLGNFTLEDGKIPYPAPAGSVTTFVAQ